MRLVFFCLLLLLLLLLFSALDSALSLLFTVQTSKSSLCVCVCVCVIKDDVEGARWVRKGVPIYIFFDGIKESQYVFNAKDMVNFTIKKINKLTYQYLNFVI